MNCENCKLIKHRCICDMDMWERALYKKLYALEDFDSFMVNNVGREAVKITVSYQHKTFTDNTGFASLFLNDMEMWHIVKGLGELANEQRDKINNKIKEYKLKTSNDENRNQ